MNTKDVPKISKLLTQHIVRRRWPVAVSAVGYPVKIIPGASLKKMKSIRPSRTFIPKLEDTTHQEEKNS